MDISSQTPQNTKEPSFTIASDMHAKLVGPRRVVHGVVRDFNPFFIEEIVDEEPTAQDIITTMRSMQKTQSQQLAQQKTFLD
ncbi:hypothetical protein M5689_018783 [Euphorbia peplus]|nr:hypothetical protein M5689_018783 [Euphorbia peplus]